MSNRVVHVEEIWSTVVSIDIRTHSASTLKAQDAIADVVQWLKDVDTVFSTFKENSAVSKFRRGELNADELDAGMQDVLARCKRIKEITDGAFDPWAVEGGYDPSGLVKGWAADRAASILATYGYRDCMVNAGGDVAVRGEPELGQPWTIGIQHPDLIDQIYATVDITNGAVATSGQYIRGEHVINPTGEKIITASATVVGNDCATADGLATALLVKGIEGFTWFDRLPGWSAQIVQNNEVTSIGPAFNRVAE